MAKAKRGKSGSSTTEAVRWEIELIEAPFTTSDWKCMVVFVTCSHYSDSAIISLISDVVHSGVRKLFSVVDYEALLSEVKEFASSKNGKGKAVGGKHQRFSEICEQVNNLLNQGETLTSQILAKLIKFKLLSIKSKDLDRREEAVKLAESKHDGRAHSKAASTPRTKSKSPGKGGKKGVKKEEKPPSPKKDTKMKKRGEEKEGFETIDDEPDGPNDPKHYIIITGFTDAAMLHDLTNMKVAVNVIINIKTEYFSKHGSTIMRASEEECLNGIDDQNVVQQNKLDTFWDDSEILIKNVPTGHSLRDVAKFDIIVKEDCIPDQTLDVLEQEKKIEFSTWLFDKVADVCFDTLEYQCQYKRYLDNLKVVNVSANQEQVAEMSPGSIVSDVALIEQKPPPVDLRYYNKLMNDIPVESSSVPIIMDCILEQVIAVTDGPNPMDITPEQRKDGLNHLVGNYLDKRLAFFGMESHGKMNMQMDSMNKKTPEVVYSGDKNKVSMLKLKDDVKSRAIDVYGKMQKYHPYSNYINYLCPSPEDWIDSCVKRRQLYQFCTAEDMISEGKFEQAMCQYIFESLPLETAVDSGNVEEPEMIEEQLEKIISCWDHPYCDMQYRSSLADVGKTISEDNMKIEIFRNLNRHTWLERFEPSILFQILDAAADNRPYLDTYYNRGNNTMLFVLHNPSNKNLQNHSSWDSWLHSDVGFRNYLEHVAFEIEDWTIEQERLEEEKTKPETPQEPTEPSPVPPPIKERSRWGLKTRAELLEEKNEQKDTEKRKKSARSRSGGSKKKSKSPSKKPSGMKSGTPSAKKNRVLSANKSSKQSTTNVKEETKVSPEKEYAFVGYNLGDNLLCVNGDLSYLFPQNGSLIKIEKFQYIQANTTLLVSVMRHGDLFTVSFVNPINAEGMEEENDEEQKLDEKKSNISTIPSITTSEYEKDQEEKVQSIQEAISVDATEEFVLPPLPQLSEPSCSYSCVNATFADGMILSFSSFVKLSEEKSEMNKILTSTSKESTESSPQSSTTAGARSTKSAKDKRGKKDDDTRLQEEAEKLLHEQQKERELRNRQKEIIQMLKDKEASRNLFITTPDGMHLSFFHKLHAEDGSIDINGKTLVLKQQRFDNPIDEESLEQRDLVRELYRCVTDEGMIIKYMSNETVNILTSDGDVYTSTPYKKSAPNILNEEKGGTTVSTSPVKKSTKTSKQTAADISTIQSSVCVTPSVVEEYAIDWHVLMFSGEQRIIKADGTEDIMDNLLMSTATCYDTNQVLYTREDGMICVQRPDGSKVVEYLDGTRITSFSEDMNTTVSNSETGEEEKREGIVSKLLKIEHDCMATVIVNMSNSSITAVFGNDRKVKGYKNGGYLISKNDENRLIIDKYGKSLLHPKHDINISADCSIELPADDLFPDDHCIMKESLKHCLKLVDGKGNSFCVDASGDFTVHRGTKVAEHETILPRYFVLYPDGSGEELLQFDDVAPYIEEAETNTSCAVLNTDIEDDDEMKAVTIIKPHQGQPSKLWKKKKDENDIIPSSLRERDFKSFPAYEVKKPGPKFGTRIGIPPTVLPNSSPTCPDVLEIRHFVRYKELTPQIRRQIVEGINKYGEFVQQQHESEDGLLRIDERSEEEKFAAEQIRKKFLENIQHADETSEKLPEEIIAEKYIDAVTPPAPPPAPRASPERSDTEWERDNIELAELKHAKSVIRKEEFPSYFDTEEGQQFLYENGILPDMEKLTNDLAYETVHPPKDIFHIDSTPRYRSQGFSTDTSDMQTSVASSTSHCDDSVYSIRSSAFSIKHDTSINTISPYVSSIDSRPLNPTPKQASNTTVSFCGVVETNDDTMLAPIPELRIDRSAVSEANESILRSLTYDVSGSLRKDLVKTPTSILGSRPNAVLNDKFQSIEEPVRRQVKTASVLGAVDQDLTSKLRGFVLLPDLVDFGILQEGLMYAFPVTMKNVGVDSCRFKIKQPPPSTGLKVVYKPGPLAAGMCTTIAIEIFALAVGVEGSCGIGQISHHVEITTETDILYLPVIATISTQEESDHTPEHTSRAGPSKGTLVLGQRPSSRESITRPRKD